MAQITREEIDHLARLARLELSDDEATQYAGQLTAIVEAVARISQVAADEIPPMSHPIPVTNVFRDDVALPGLDRDDVREGAPAWEDDRFRVPRILDDD